MNFLLANIFGKKNPKKLCTINGLGKTGKNNAHITVNICFNNKPDGNTTQRGTLQKISNDKKLNYLAVIKLFELVRNLTSSHYGNFYSFVLKKNVIDMKIIMRNEKKILKFCHG